MSHRGKPLSNHTWNTYQKLLFRFFFIYFLIQALPFSREYFVYIFQINWLELHYGDIFNLTRYAPNFVGGADSFSNWAIAALIALTGLIAWTLVDKKNNEYNLLYYWLRVVVRYRLAIGVIGYGFIKLFPLQAPFPSISNLNTHYGDFSNWKIFSITLGIVPSYQAFLGLVEITAGLLLLFRKTAFIGAFIVILFTGNVVLSNLAYEGGEYVYSLYLISFALFLLADDAIRLYRFFGLEKAVSPNRYKPLLIKSWQKNGRLVVKGALIFFFVFLYGFKTYLGYHEEQNRLAQDGDTLQNAAGIYDVAEFRINNKLLPYSTTDPLRWKDVVIERWPTISIRSNRPVVLEHLASHRIEEMDEDGKYELSGSASRHYYYYSIDGPHGQLVLQNKNENHRSETLVFHYTTPAKDQIILNGVTENNDSIYAVLHKVNKKYLLIEAAGGRGKPIKL